MLEQNKQKCKSLGALTYSQEENKPNPTWLDCQEKAKKLLEFLKHSFTLGQTFWAKTSHGDFWQCKLEVDGTVSVYRSGFRANGKLESKNPGDKYTREIDYSKKYDLTYLIQQTTKKDGGLFFFPGLPIDLPLKEDPNGNYYSKGTHFISAECDTESLESQLAFIEWFEGLTGLKLCVIFTGGKSYHIHILLTEQVSVELRVYLSWLLTILCTGDPAMPQINQVMRLPYGYRTEKSKWQELISQGEKCTLDDAVKGLKLAFEAKGLPYPISPESLSETHRKKIREVLAPKDNEKNKPLTKDEKETAIREILEKSEDEFNPKHTYKPTYTPTLEIAYTGAAIPLEILLTNDDQKDLKGVSGNRHTTGDKLAKSLIAVENWANQNDIQVTGTAHDLFIEYCQSCSTGNGWDSREWDSIWTSNSQGSPSPSKSDDVLRSDVDKWRKKHDKEYAKEAKRLEGINKSKTQVDLDSIKKIVKLAKQFTATVTIENEQYLTTWQEKTNFYFKEYNAYLIKSALGTAKTTMAYRAIRKYCQSHPNCSVINLGIRNNLLRQGVANYNKENEQLLLEFEQKIQEYEKAKYKPGENFVHIHDLKKDIDLLRDKLIALCIDSLLKIDIDQLVEPVVLIDEFNSFLHYIYNSTTAIKAKRIEIIEQLIKLLNKAKVIVGLDGHMTDKNVQWLKDNIKTPEMQFNCIFNTFKTDKQQPIKYLQGTHFDQFKSINRFDIRPMIKDIFDLATAERVESFVIGSESQKHCECFDMELTAMGVKTFRLDSKTTDPTSHTFIKTQEFLDDPKVFILKYKIQVLIYSPSGDAGLDISIFNYFKHIFLFFWGVNKVNIVNAILQMSSRVRDDIPVQMWVSPQAVWTNNIKKNLNSFEAYKQEWEDQLNLKVGRIVTDNNLSMEQKVILANNIQSLKDYHFNQAKEQRYFGELEGKYLREFVKEELIETGRIVEDWIVTDPLYAKKAQLLKGSEKSALVALEEGKITEDEYEEFIELKKKTKQRIESFIKSYQEQYASQIEFIKEKYVKPIEALKTEFDPTFKGMKANIIRIIDEKVKDWLNSFQTEYTPQQNKIKETYNKGIEAIRENFNKDYFDKITEIKEECKKHIKVQKAFYPLVTFIKIKEIKEAYKPLIKEAKNNDQNKQIELLRTERNEKLKVLWEKSEQYKQIDLLRTERNEKLKVLWEQSPQKEQVEQIKAQRIKELKVLWEKSEQYKQIDLLRTERNEKLKVLWEQSQQKEQVELLRTERDYELNELFNSSQQKEQINQVLKDAGKEYLQDCEIFQGLTQAGNQFKEVVVKRNERDSREVFYAAEPSYCYVGDALKHPLVEMRQAVMNHFKGVSDWEFEQAIMEHFDKNLTGLELWESPTESWAIQAKAYIYNTLGQSITKTEIWSPELINIVRNTQPHLLKLLTREVKLENKLIDKNISSRKYKKLIKRQENFLLNVDDEYGLLAGLRDIGLINLLNSKEAFKLPDNLEDMPDIIKNMIASYRKSSFKTLLPELPSYHTKAKDVKQWLDECLGLLGYEIKSKRVRNSKIKGQDNRTYVYKVERIFNNPVVPVLKEHILQNLKLREDVALLTDWHPVLILPDLVEIRLKDTIQNLSDDLPSEGILDPEKELLKSNGQKIAESIAPYGFDAVQKISDSLIEKIDQKWTDNFETVPEKLAPAVPQQAEEYKLDEINHQLDISGAQIEPLTPLQKKVIAISTKSELENLLSNNGLEEVATAINAAIPSATSVNDKQATFYQWLAEIVAGVKLKYVGVQCFITKFVHFGEQIKVALSNGLGIATLSELAEPIDSKKALWYG